MGRGKACRRMWQRRLAVAAMGDGRGYGGDAVATTGGRKKTVAPALGHSGVAVYCDRQPNPMPLEQRQQNELEQFAKRCGRKVRGCDILARPNCLRGWKPHLRKSLAKGLQYFENRSRGRRGRGRGRGG